MRVAQGNYLLPARPVDRMRAQRNSPLLTALTPIHHAGSLLEVEEQRWPREGHQDEERRPAAGSQRPSAQATVGRCLDADLRGPRGGTGASARLHVGVEVQR